LLQTTDERYIAASKFDPICGNILSAIENQLVPFQFQNLFSLQNHEEDNSPIETIESDRFLTFFRRKRKATIRREDSST
jgi:hypothetical protein